ncbi:hypothetical protein EDD31_1356 [Bogoriella caseilytica]|uniref:Uncharacterized protein n=1 Tax=Bogoriella caseilytica TaxID=56055 RepID=A0A3N2BCK7_9MICO|nr:hypothetical protein EDD31_1356 [Bogoriella caseilytica]
MLEFRTYDLIWSAVYIVMVSTALVLMILGCVALVKYIRTPARTTRPGCGRRLVRGTERGAHTVTAVVIRSTAAPVRGL